ncbi:MAG TPA: C-type lectin domain-containing protein, partial [Polyangia bacterium]|nr:C-type lectin domain-containing protein [Polyangia bacterium]
GAGGTAGTGGVAGAGGRGGAGGTGGAHPSCKGFPSGASMTLPEDNFLHCYWAHGNTFDWNSAETQCENEGGTLVTILSSDENMLVLHLATQANLFLSAGAVPTVFIGASDKKASNDDSGPGDYVWVTGEPWAYDNWHGPNLPNGACTGCSGPGGACACAHWAAIAADGTWYDRQEAPARPFVCEATVP